MSQAKLRFVADLRVENFSRQSGAAITKNDGRHVCRGATLALIVPRGTPDRRSRGCNLSEEAPGLAGQAHVA